MRKTSLLVAVVATIVAVLGTMAGVGIGQTIGSRGGTPSDMYTQTWEGDACADLTLNQGGQAVFDQGFTLEAESNVTVFFSFELGFESRRQEALITFGLDWGNETSQDWTVPAAPATANYWANGHSTALTWTFERVEVGDHSLQTFAVVGPGVAQMNGCALTVLVSPVVE